MRGHKIHTQATMFHWHYLRSSHVCVGGVSCIRFSATTSASTYIWRRLLSSFFRWAINFNCDTKCHSRWFGSLISYKKCVLALQSHICYTWFMPSRLSSLSFPFHFPYFIVCASYFYSINFQRHVLQVGQCLPQVCTTDDIRTILNADAAAIKFNEIYINATDDADTKKNGISVINVRRVPGEYVITQDPAFYLTM